jgi:hypothetical protein
MGILHEVLVATGVVLVLFIACGLNILGHEYMRTGHFSQSAAVSAATQPLAAPQGAAVRYRIPARAVR